VRIRCRIEPVNAVLLAVDGQCRGRVRQIGHRVLPGRSSRHSPVTLDLRSLGRCQSRTKLTTASVMPT
jgi:hypothetical protein